MHNYVFARKSDAKWVLAELKTFIRDYGVVTLAELNEFIGHRASITYTQNVRGWTKLKKAKVIKTSAGYLLLLPEPKLLNW